MASCNSTDILATAYRNGYAKLSSRDLMVAAIASACSTCDAQPLIETAIGLGYLKLSEFDAAMCIAESLCSSPGVTAAPAPTILKLAMQDHLAAMSRRDLDGVIAALLCKMTNPPCVTPATPGTPAAFSTLNNIIKIAWTQPPNSGSLILNYTVSYGTTQGGPYTSTVTVPAMTKQAILSGLTVGTTYYFVVKANSFTGCSSASSSEGSATTSGVPASTPMLTAITQFGTTRNDLPAYMSGIMFATGAAPITVTHLGLWKIAGNVGTHTVVLADANHAAPPPNSGLVSNGIANVNVDLTTGAAGSFIYVALGAPVVLAANAVYQIYAFNVAGDFWYDQSNTTLATFTADFNATYFSIYITPQSTGAIAANNIGGPQEVFGVVNLKYHL